MFCLFRYSRAAPEGIIERLLQVLPPTPVIDLSGGNLIQEGTRIMIDLPPICGSNPYNGRITSGLPVTKDSGQDVKTSVRVESDVDMVYLSYLVARKNR
jgi:hypothetical protein